MKYLIIGFTILFHSSVYSQNVVYKDSVFEDFSSGLYKQFIIKSSNTPVLKFKTEIKNWIGVYFRDSESVIDTDTDNKMILKVQIHEATFAILIFEFKDERIRVSIYDRLIEAPNQFGILVETDVRSSFRNLRASTEADKIADGIMEIGWRYNVQKDVNGKDIIKSKYDFYKVQLATERVEAISREIINIDFTDDSTDNW